MKRLRALGLLGWGVCIATILALSLFGVIYGKDGFQQQAVWFLAYNVIGYVLLFVLFYLHEVWRAPGELLARDITREIAKDFALKIQRRFGEGGRLSERLQLDGYSPDIRKEFDAWVEATRADIVSLLPNFESVFDDVEVGGLGPILDLPMEIRDAPWKKRSPEEIQRDRLVNALSRRRANLNSIYHHMLPMIVGGSERKLS